MYDFVVMIMKFTYCSCININSVLTTSFNRYHQVNSFDGMPVADTWIKQYPFDIMRANI